MAKVVVIEGADGVGKSTMAQFIAHENAWNLEKMTAPRDKETGEGQIMLMLRAINKLKKNDGIVLDRSWLGEFVYPQLFRNYQQNDDFMRYIQDELEGHDVLYILVRSSHNWALRHFAHDGKTDKYANVNTVQRLPIFGSVQREFVRALNRISFGSKFVFNQTNYPNKETALAWAALVVNRWRNKFQMYDKCDPMYALTCWNPKERFVDGSMKVNHECICGHFKDTKLYPFWKKNHSITWGVGNVSSPLFVMVGEAPGMHGCGTTGIPFYFDKSGFFLKQLLFEHGIAETEYYMTNISKCNPKDNKINPLFADDDAAQNLEYELTKLPKDVPYIALGNTAYLWLKTYHPELDIRKLFHPAWALYKGAYTEYRQMFTCLMEAIVP